MMPWQEDTSEGNCHMSASHDWSNLSIKRLWRFHWACHVEVAGWLHHLTQLPKFWISSLRSESDCQLLHNKRHLCDAVPELSYIRSKAGLAWYDGSQWAGECDFKSRQSQISTKIEMTDTVCLTGYSWGGTDKTAGTWQSLTVISFRGSWGCCDCCQAP